MKIFKLGIIILVMLGLGACSTLFGPPALKDSVIEADILTMSGFPQGTVISKDLNKEKNASMMVITGTVAIETTNATMHISVHLSYAYSDSAWKPGFKNFTIESYSDIKANPEPGDARIRHDIESLPDFVSDPSVKDKIVYTVTKDPESTWTVKGQLDWSTDSCDVSGGYTLVYVYNGTSWDLTSNNVEVTSINKINHQPVFTTIYQQVEQAYETWYDNYVLPQEMDSTVLTSDLVAGTASFTSKYTLKDGPMLAKATVTVNGIFEYGAGWVFTIGTKSFDTTIDYTGFYTLTWDILDTETFYKNNEVMTLKVTGQIHFLGSSIWGSESIISNSIQAVVNFRGKTITVEDVHPDPIGTYPTLILIEFGSGPKERVYLAYGQESYRDWGYMGFRFYGISADESHAVIELGR
jgi:hypothetical protein